MKGMRWCLSIVWMGTLLLPVPYLAANWVKKCAWIKRISSLEKHQYVRQYKVKARALKAYAAKQKAGNKQQAISVFIHAYPK